MSIGNSWSSITRKISVVLASSALLLTANVNAAWQVDKAKSQLSLVSIKNAAVTEVHTFERLDGGLMDSGEFSFLIDLASIQTGIDIRNTRMQEMLFNIAEFPRAVISAKVDMNKLAHLDAGESMTLSQDFDLTLKGKTKSLSAEVTVTRLNKDGLLLTSLSPILINAQDFALSDGIEALRNIAGLKSINQVVPVTFSVTLNQI